MRVSEFFDFINRERLPSKLERKFLYTHITIDEKIMRLRRQNLKKTQLKKVGASNNERL